jgi:hypothetical protein
MVIDFCWYYPGMGKIDPPNQKYDDNKFDVDLVMDEFGRAMPATTKFPSCKDGFKPMADYVHSKGLKFGIHIMRGIPKQAVAQKCKIMGTDITADKVISYSDCEWLNHFAGMDMYKKGAQEYLDSIIKMYAVSGLYQARRRKPPLPQGGD